MIDLEVEKALEVLNNGGVILYPTDTVWGLGCDATNAKAVERIFQIKKREESKSLILLVSDVEMLSIYVNDFNKDIQQFIENQSRPTSVIYNQPVGIAQNTIAADGSVAIRMVNQNFCNTLLQQFGKPIVSTSANISGNATPQRFSDISASILDSVDYTVNLQRDKFDGESSQIVRFNQDNQPEFIRK